MKKEFTFQEVLKLKGCYSEAKVHGLLSVDKIYSIIELMNLPISIVDRLWFIYNSCGLTKDQKIELCILLGKAVAPIYNEKYPDDNRVNDCWKAIADFRKGKIDRQKLLENSDAAYAAYAYADAASCAAAAAANAAYASSNIYNTSNAATHASYAADNAADKSYSEKLNELLIIFCDEQPVSITK